MNLEPPSTGYQPGSPRQRITAIVLSAAILIIALLIAIFQTQVSPVFERARALVSFDVREQGSQARQATKASPQRQPKPATKRQAPSVGLPPPKIRIAKPIPRQDALEKAIPGFIALSGDDLASADIGKLRGKAGGSGGGGKAAYGPGEGPGGVRLYNAEWYREPTDAQLGGYIPAKAPRSGWGIVACQTVEHYHVDNCQILDESPLGSGFGRAVQNAAWQFLVMPPRINNERQVGAWVRIRITYGSRSGESG